MTPLTLAEIALLCFAYIAGTHHALLQLGPPQNDRDAATHMYVAIASGGPRAVSFTAILFAVATLFYDLV